MRVRDNQEDAPVAQDAYDALAESYAALVDTKPHNAYYERPATLSLLPDVEGKRVLDIASHDGRWTMAAIDAGASHVLGIEARKALVDAAHATFAKYAVMPKKFGFITGDVHDVLTRVPPGSIDTVLCLGFFYHTIHHGLLLARSLADPLFRALGLFRSYRSDVRLRSHLGYALRKQIVSRISFADLHNIPKPAKPLHILTKQYLHTVTLSAHIAIGQIIKRSHVSQSPITRLTQ